MKTTYELSLSPHWRTKALCLFTLLYVMSCVLVLQDTHAQSIYKGGVDIRALKGPPIGRSNMSMNTQQKDMQNVMARGTRKSTQAQLLWTTRTPMPVARSWAPAVVYNGKIYVVGGCSSTQPQQFSNPVSNLEVYDPAADSWTELSPMPSARVAPAAAIVNGKIYVMGGFDPSYYWSANPTVEIYDIASNSWSSGPSMPVGCSWASAVVVNGKIYVLGGVGTDYFNLMQIFDPSTNSWSLGPSFVGGRYLCASTTYNGKIYLIGGDSWETGTDTVYNDIQVYDPIGNSWASEAPMPSPATGLSSVAVGEYIYVFGDPLARRYNVSNDSWQDLSTNQDTNGGFSVCNIGSTVYRFGGGGWGPTTGIVQSADLSQLSSHALKLSFDQIDASRFPSIDCYVSALDSTGTPISGLVDTNFVVYENTRLQNPFTVTALANQPLPISVALVIDRSGSMYGQPLQDAKNAATSFVSSLRSVDRAAIISFSDQVTVDQPFTTDSVALKNAIQALVANGATAIYDAVYTALASLSSESLQRKAVVLLTDGGDNSSQYSLGDVIHYANQLGLSVYTIGLGLTPGSSEEMNLVSLADSTGGKYYYAPTSSDLASLYNSIARSIQNQYKISYVTNNPAFDATLRKVKIVAQYLSESDTAARDYVAPSGANWLIKVSAVMDSLADVNNYAGVNFNASDSLDSYDAPEPPHPPTNYLQLYFPHPEWGSILGPLFSKDVRRSVSLSRHKLSFKFEVSTDRVNRDITIQILPDSLVPSNYLIVLVDVDGGQRVVINGTNYYTYNSGSGGIRHFILKVGNLIAQKMMSQGWNLTSVPLIQDPDSLLQVLSSSISGNFYAYKYTTTQGYSIADTLIPGRGFWLGLTSNSTINEAGSEPPDTLMVPLGKFWNIVGIPGLYPRYKSGIYVQKGNEVESLDSAISLNWVQGAFYGFSTISGSYEVVDTLLPWSGYWFAALTDSVSIVFMPESILRSATFQRRLFVTNEVPSVSNGWNIPLYAYSSSGSENLLASFGVSARSHDGFDSKYDLPEPPSPPVFPGKNEIRVYFPHPEWKFVLGPNFVRDVKDTTITNAGKVWAMKVYSSSADKITLRWKSSDVPSGQYVIQLFDSLAGRVVDMISDSSYTFSSSGSEDRAFGIIVRRVISPVSNSNYNLPDKFTVYQNYPNPFNPTTTISFDVPVRSDVKLIVYDILGREVKMLVNESKAPGNYTVVFDASNLPSGVYFYKMIAGNFVQTRKLVVVK